MGVRQPGYVVDADDPRAPPQELWDRMAAAERAEVLASLPSEFSPSEALPPEGDPHFDEVVRTRDVLRGFFDRTGRPIYVGNNLPVYYPAEAMFSPDVIAVVDVPVHAREHWTVSAEGKGLDVAMEILWSGSRSKDLRDNVQRYARLGIREYFVFDRRRLRLHGHRLPASGAGSYQPMLAQGGVLTSEVLGLELGIEGEKLRFFVAGAPLPESRELLARLDATLTRALQRAEEEAERAQDAGQRAEQEARRAQDEMDKRVAAETRLAEALAELAALRAKNPG